MAESRMELFIETLTGTAFELSCSPSETVVSIKAKIQYSEGIPVSQQHLIWKSQELNDDMCLQDYSITDGSTLKLVLGMRGGPINTRQVSDSKKFKDLTEFVESRSGSSSQPFTVLVFHDGEKVHMYTLLENGECTVSPLSGTISETSSITSVRNIDELDEEILKENEVTREKIAHLQEQLRSLNISKSQRPLNHVSANNFTVESTITSDDSHEEFHLPPIQQVGTIGSDSLCTQTCAPIIRKVTNKFKMPTSQKNISNTNIPKAHSGNQSCRADSNSTSHKVSLRALDFIAKKISTYVLTSPDNDSQDHSAEACTRFLPPIVSARRNKVKQTVLPNILSSNSKMGSIQRQVSSDSLIKYDPSSSKRTYKSLPHTSSSQSHFDIDTQIETRPKTSPGKPTAKVCYAKLVRKRKHKEERFNQRLRSNSLRLGITAVEKSNLIKFLKDCSIVPSNSPGSIKGSSSPVENVLQDSFNSISKIHKDELPSLNGDSMPSTKNLPLIKTKKKSYNRCSLCSKKTGLATSYTCRCGKNFCASHRYAETHHCTYDYKLEGRKMLQLHNPVITAPKLPKI